MALTKPHLVITHTINLDWDPNTQLITNPIQPTMNVGDTVTVSSSYGKNAMIRFLSPFGDPIATVKEGDVFTLLVGGIYQFECFIDGQQAKNGGGVEVIPHKP
ncbi:MAG TPA: hypothetical protein VGK22_01020 [Candidatus Angelobacter sp.]|jgi:hypothetical protein